MTGQRIAPAMTLLVVVAGAAAFGDAAAMVTLMLRLSQAGHSAWAITALLFAILGPSVILAPFAGRLLGRGRAWPLLVLTSAGQAVAAVALIVARGTGPDLALVTAIGAGLALTQPTLLEITPTVAGPDRLAWANSLTRSASWTGWTVGPLTGGALCATGLAAAALGIEAASFVLAGACFAVLSRLPAAAPPAPAAVPASSAPDQADVAGTIRYILRDRVLAGLIASVGITNICVSMTGVAEVFFAREVLRTGSVGFASLSSAWFGGMIIGTLAAPWAVVRRPSAAAPAGIGVAGAGIVAAAVASVLPTAVLGYGVGGIGFGLQATVVRTMIQRRADGPLRGRVFGIWVATDMSTQLAGYLAGGAAMLVGARATLTIAGAGLCSVSCAAAALTARPVFRRLQHEQP